MCCVGEWCTASLLCLHETFAQCEPGQEGVAAIAKYVQDTPRCADAGDAVSQRCKANYGHLLWVQDPQQLLVVGDHQGRDPGNKDCELPGAGGGRSGQLLCRELDDHLRVYVVSKYGGVEDLCDDGKV